MPIAIEDPSRNSAEHLRKLKHSRLAAAGGFSSQENNTREALARLTGLLISAPIDLGGISHEIRRHPDLETLILRLGVSLVLSPDEPLTTVEEAVVVLGTSRLRILIDLWSSAGNSSDDPPPSSPNAAAGEPAPPATTPEISYLINFLRSVGFHSPENAFTGARLAAWASKISPDQMFVLADLFMHDFFSLLPVIHPGIKEVAAPPSREHISRTEP
jgi:hypothetical protein